MLDSAMILAAGRGARMRPLTDHLPKPLLEVGGKALIVWQIERLVGAGFKRIVINHAWLGHKIEAALGDGSRWGVRISYSAETTALETAGGIAKARPLLGDKPFLVVNGDVFCTFNLNRAHSLAAQLEPWGSPKIRRSAWCIMVPNAPHHPHGDFAVRHGVLTKPAPHSGLHGLTFSGIAIYHPQFFDPVPKEGALALRPLLEEGVSRGNIGAEVFEGLWLDIGTPERLAALDTELRGPLSGKIAHCA
jgi:N-acetyl-alpha-D-muramate 1-phosphate uridylyltransferase